MQREEVVSILESLTDGQPTKIVEALTTAAEWLRKIRDRPAAAGTKWTPGEDALLCDAFDAGTPIRELARQHGRTAAAIRIRLAMLGRLDMSAVASRGRGARVAS